MRKRLFGGGSDLGAPRPGEDVTVGRGQRAAAERYHNRALEAGFESEIAYFDNGQVSVTVRNRGDQEPHFQADVMKREFPDEPEPPGGWVTPE